MSEARQLKCRLTEEEVAAAASELAAKLDEIDSIKLAAKAAADEFKAQIGEVEKRAATLRAMVRDHAETRAVPVEAKLDYKAGVAHIIRLDTGEQIEARPLTDDERAQSLPGIHVEKARTSGSATKRGARHKSAGAP